jgi:hypothetical protein
MMRQLVLLLLLILLIAADSPSAPTGAASISFDKFWPYFAIGAMGAASLELLKLYEYRGHLGTAKVKKLLASPLFWAVVVGMLGASGFLAWAMYANSNDASILHIAAAGAAVRSLIRQGGGATVANQGKVTLGEQGITLAEIFR